jgi:hypothetical protein
MTDDALLEFAAHVLEVELDLLAVRTYTHNVAVTVGAKPCVLWAGVDYSTPRTCCSHLPCTTRSWDDSAPVSGRFPVAWAC